MNTADDILFNCTAKGKELFAYIKQKILHKEWLANEKIPAERELSEQFKVSRGTTRKVLGCLKEMGWVVQTVGSGTFVASNIQDLVKEKMPEDERLHVSPAELMDARLLIEPLMPSLIVKNATVTDFNKMMQCIEEAEKATAVEQFEYWDGALHEALACATHNKFFIRLLGLMNEIREQGEWGILKKKSLTETSRKTYELQHRKIVEVLKNRDEEQSRRHLLQHLIDVRENLFKK